MDGKSIEENLAIIHDVNSSINFHQKILSQLNKFKIFSQSQYTNIGTVRPFISVRLFEKNKTYMLASFYNI